MPEQLSISQPVPHHQHKTVEKCENSSVRMSTQKQLFTALISVLAIQLIVAKPFSSVEEEETTTKSSGTTCSVVIGAHLPPRAVENSYEVFAKVLVRDSEKATRQKLREVKAAAAAADKEIFIGHFYIMLKTFRDVNVTREGELMYKALTEIVHQANNGNENLFEDGFWFYKIIDEILCLVLNAKAEQNMVDNVVENYSMLEAISTHFDLFTKFWLDYRPAKGAQ